MFLAWALRIFLMMADKYKQNVIFENNFYIENTLSRLLTMGREMWGEVVPC